LVSNSANTPSMSRNAFPAAVLVSMGCSVAFKVAPPHDVPEIANGLRVLRLALPEATLASHSRTHASPSGALSARRTRGAHGSFGPRSNSPRLKEVTQLLLAAQSWSRLRWVRSHHLIYPVII